MKNDSNEVKTTQPGPRIKTIDLVYISIGAALIAICSWISIPTAVPFTLQTFAVFAVLSILGGRRGTISVAVYILMGAVGLPVFAGFKGGIGVLFGRLIFAIAGAGVGKVDADVVFVGCAVCCWRCKPHIARIVWNNKRAVALCHVPVFCGVPNILFIGVIEAHTQRYCV